MHIRDVFAVNLRKRRKEAGLTQEGLAYLACLDRTYISSLERSIYSASIDVVDRIAKALDADASEMLHRQARRKR